MESQTLDMNSLVKNKEALYIKGKATDELLPILVKKHRKHMVDKNDDYFVMIVGKTGTGKSNVALHIYDFFTEENPEHKSIDAFALRRVEFANSLNYILNTPIPRFLAYDEANVSKRDAMTQWNKDIIDLYLTCRVLGIYHIWANPVLDGIDKVFVQDRIRAVILLLEKDKYKDKGLPRRYYYFRKRDILRFYNKYETLNLDLLEKVKDEYCWYWGRFLPYEGDLLQAYTDKKGSSAESKVKTFFDKYGDDGFIRTGDVMKELGISENTFVKYRAFLEKDVDYMIAASGRYKFHKSAIPKLRSIMESSRSKVVVDESD